MRAACCLVLFSALSGCNTDDPHVIYEPGDTTGTGDTTPPVIEHDPVEAAQLYGQEVPLSATVTDADSNVFIVQVYYRQETSSIWQSTTLMDVDSDTIYDGQIPAGDVMTGGMYYYLYAMDTEENEGYFPSGGASDPFHFRISPD
jgi:hypothetical protein